MKKPPLIHPFLLALFPTIFLLAQNIEMVLLSQTLLPLAIVVGFTTFFLVLLTILLKESRKAGIIVSFMLILFFSYGHVFELVESVVEGQPGGNLDHGPLLMAWALLFVSGATIAVKIQDTRRWTTILNVVAIALIAPSLMEVGLYELRVHGLKRTQSWAAAEQAPANLEKERNEPPPDIYYIILDRYASASTLEEEFHVDNSAFIDYLKGKGFYVAEESLTNYPKTFQSLASSLNMKHLTYLTDELGRDTATRTPVYKMLENYEAWRVLKAQGYNFIHIGSSWEPTRYNKYADVNFTVYPAEFMMMLYRNTVLEPLGAKLTLLDEREMERRAILRKFEAIAEIPEREGPNFVFAHMLLPHAPYLFGPQGETITEEQEEARTFKENYLNQLLFTNQKVKTLVDQILSRSERPPIIILQADEGPFIPYLHEFGGAGTDWRQLSDGAVKTHMRILNAYYLPDTEPETILYPSITPVNSFRVIFDHYFDTNYGLLADESYIFEDTLHPYTFINVTDRVKYD